MNIYLVIITLVACFTLKTFAVEHKASSKVALESEKVDLSHKQLKLIVKTLQVKEKKKS